nr:MAP7 domain-containing protein 1-like [Aegilops tauschii subsp. strangulata]
MPDFNAHGLDPAWGEPPTEKVQEFFDNLSENYVCDEPLLIRDTSKEELDYIATREALAKEADLGEESSAEEAEADDPPAAGRKRVLWRASSGVPVRLGRTTQQQPAHEQLVRQTRGMKATPVKETVKAAVAKKTVTASSSSKWRRTPSPSPPPSDSALEAEHDLGSFSPKTKMRQEAEDEDMETLALRVAKRARMSMGSKPPASTSHTPELVEISPDNSPRRSPRFSPQRTAGTRAPTEGEVFDDEALSIARLQVVDEPCPGDSGSQEEQLLRAMGANFQKLQALHRARLDKAKSRLAAVDKEEADLEERVAQTQAWFCEAREGLKAAQDELAERKWELILKQADEEDLAAREEALTTTLRGKDEEVEKLVAQRTQRLEQKHKDALHALALDHAGKVKELEVELDGLKKEVLELKEEKETANGALADAEALKLEGLEGKLSEAGAREETLNKDPEEEKRLRRDGAAEYEEYAKGVNLWIGRRIDVAGRLTA